jgi:salicylate hydroxylase/6-hydroxynicotinate 3-monooxygenase
MTPYMAQSAAMAFEDAAVLSRCLHGVDRSGVADAFRRFELKRKPRTSQIQLGSRTNTWLRNKTDPDWVYGYDAWTKRAARDHRIEQAHGRRGIGEVIARVESGASRREAA